MINTTIYVNTVMPRNSPILKFATLLNSPPFLKFSTETPQIRQFLHAYGFSTTYFYIKNK